MIAPSPRVVLCAKQAFKGHEPAGKANVKAVPVKVFGRVGRCAAETWVATSLGQARVQLWHYCRDIAKALLAVLAVTAAVRRVTRFTPLSDGF